MNNKKHIWLFGENIAETSNNNSFYFWKHIVEKQDEVEKFFIMSKNKHNKKTYKLLNKKEKKNIIWKNSLKHYITYLNASMSFVTLSYKDVMPNFLFLRRRVHIPTIYLQHGTLAIKKIEYTGTSYNNNMFRFCYYNKDIKDILVKENDFKEYQLLYSEFHPRYQELIKRYESFKRQRSNSKNILWFITWREYFGDNQETQKFIENIKSVLNNYKFKEYLEKNNYKLKICLHQFFDKEKIKYMTNSLKNQNIEIVTPQNIDVMDEIVKNDILITDYSSIAFDFTLLGKTVFLYQPDIQIYSKTRNFYYLNEMKKYSISTPTKLVQELKKNTIETNEFFRKRLPENIDFDYLKSGKHIDKIYNELYNIQDNEITFIGYNFFGKGGTISATLALAEGLLEKNYLVKLISLKKNIKKIDFPHGLNVTALYYTKRYSLQYIVKRLLFISKKHYSYLKYDSNMKNLIPYAGVALRKKLKNIKSKTIVSTRETLHLFVKDIQSEKVKNKVYFFHTFYSVVKEQFGGLIDKLKNTKLEKAVFITENGRKQYIEKAGYDQYEEYEIISNSLESSKMIQKEDIKGIKKKGKYNSAYFLRISKDRVKDVDNLFEFAKYMKKMKFNKLTIHVYGVGDYLEEFEKRIEEENLSKYIKYEGLAVNIKEELEKYDIVTDFTLNHSFGMTYLEAIFNGKMVFGMINEGSKEALNDIPYCYINSFEDLLNKINNLDKITIDDLKKNYGIMESKYSRDVTTEKFLKYINKGQDNFKNE